jgi:hypothetical protein
VTEPVYLSDAERELIETLAQHLPEPGTRCPTCHRRVNKPRSEDSPAIKEVRLRGPVDRVEALQEGLDTLQEFSGVDPYSYPGVTLLEALLALGAVHREELKAHFEGEA